MRRAGVGSLWDPSTATMRTAVATLLWQIFSPEQNGAEINEKQPLPWQLTHSFCRAARGRWKAFECGRQQHAPDKQGVHAVLSSCTCCSWVRGRPRHHPASKTRSSCSDFVYSTAIAVRLSRWPAQSRRMGRRQAQKPGRAGADPHAWESLSCPSSTDFFSLFVIMSCGLLGVCWCS